MVTRRALILAVLALSALAQAQKPPASRKLGPGALAPLPASAKPAWTHAPFEVDDCSLCHKSKDPKNPGPLAMPTNELCLSCHEWFKNVLKRKVKHPPAQESCTNCHNPHNSRQRMLLLEDTVGLCDDCHADVVKTAKTAKTRHAPTTSGNACASCHNPHGSDREHLLARSPFDLCLGCHTREQTDPEGKKLVSFKKLLDENPKEHAPVEAKDCTACHKPHGSDHFRLLAEAYPASFYAPFDTRKYALCFSCHEESMVTTAQTTTLTQFRDGSRNLHFVHVNRSPMGRTCRACHEVHAAKQDHLIREGVPYGIKGWVLKINYTQLPNGGSCERTCHSARSYDNAR